MLINPDHLALLVICFIICYFSAYTMCINTIDYNTISGIYNATLQTSCINNSVVLYIPEIYISKDLKFNILNV